MIYKLIEKIFRLIDNENQRFKIQDLYCHVHNNYIEAIVGNEILKSQAPYNQIKIHGVKKITQVETELKT